MRNLLLSALLLASAFQIALGEQAGDWTYTVSNNQATITGYTGAGGAVTIPSEVNGIPVVQFGYRFGAVFGWYNESVTSITIPNTVTTIGYAAFYGCARLASITIPNSVTSISWEVFYGCTSLTSITIPNSVTSIGQGAFNNCTSLASFVIPNSWTSIPDNMFRDCTSLTSITIPTNVTSIGVGAFIGCTSLTTIAIPNSVTSIGDSAFYGCTSLISFTMPDKFIAQVAQIGIGGQVATDYLVNALANNDAFITAVANKIKSTGGNFGIATQSGLSSAITTAVEPLATKSELTSSLTQSRTDGINSVLSNPNLWTLYTTSQIQNMAVGDLVLTRQVSGGFVLNYDIEQSSDLQTWTPYQALSLPLTGLPADKAFVRIKVINSTPNPPNSSPNPSYATPSTSNL